MRHSAKNRVLLSALALLFSTAITFSCKPDKCKSVTCNNGGSCNGGSCTCALGFYGTRCDSNYRTAFTGSWTVNESGSLTGARTYSTAISAGTSSNTIVISNFYNYFTAGVSATVVKDTMYILLQRAQGKILMGIGYISPSGPGKLQVRYEVVDSASQLTDDFGFVAGDTSAYSVWTN